jgi:hypothetical protein
MGPVHNELTASDVAGLRAWFVRDNRTGATSVLGLALLAAFGMLGFGTLASGDSIGFVALVSIVVLGVIASRLSRRSRRIVDAQIAANKSSIVTADEHGIVFRSPSATVTLQWAHFTELVEIDHLLILRCSAFGGHAIAKRNVESRRAAGAYADALEQVIGCRSDAGVAPTTTVRRRRSRQFRRLNIVVTAISLLVLGGFAALFLAEALR